MPAPETSHRFQPAVLWPVIGFDSYGQFTVGPPEEIRVRWTNSRQETLDPKGNVIALDATAVVDMEIGVGSKMWLGELSAWYGTGSGVQQDGLMEVKTISIAPDVKNRFVMRTLGLMLYKDDLP